LDEEKVKTCRFGSGKWFSLSIIAQFGVVGAATQCTCRKHCNKYDLTVSISDWPIINDWSRWVAIISVPSTCFAVPVSVLWVGLQKEKKLNWM
jgi:hypothetical protein